MAKPRKINMIRKPNKLVWLHDNEDGPGFWLDDTDALAKQMNAAMRLGEQRERQRVVSHVAQVVEAAGMGKAPWPIMKAILEKLQGEFERGDHVAKEEK